MRSFNKKTIITGTYIAAIILAILQTLVLVIRFQSQVNEHLAKPYDWWGKYQTYSAAANHVFERHAGLLIFQFGVGILLTLLITALAVILIKSLLKENK